MSPELYAILIPSFILVSLLYASVGHGGASGYLAILSFTAIAPLEMATSALCLNLLVSGLAFFAFWKAGHFSFRFTWPFVAASVPAAFIGGLLPISIPLYKLLLAVALAFAAFRLAVNIPQKADVSHLAIPRLSVALPVGGGIGLLSGIVGVGGGIFLSPLLLLKGWADPKRIAASSAIFIWVNSFAGLLGRLVGGQFQLGMGAPLLAAAFIGGLIGARLGANHFSGITLRRLLALVLVIAVFKLVVASMI